MAEEEFYYPEIFKGNDADEIEQRMLDRLPDDIDKMPGGFAYDFTKPTAIEKDDIINYYLVRTLMLSFPDWAWGDWLDMHGRRAGINVTRKQAGYASGKVTFTGSPGTTLIKGFQVCTAASGDTESVVFAIDSDVTIPDSGSIEASITATEPGTGSNVAAGTIVLMVQPASGISKVNNANAITGGTDTETDDDYRARILEVARSSGASYIGNDADYIRWAKEVTGIGNCIVVSGDDYKGPGTVKLALVDSNGTPANEKLCEAVYDHIISPNDRTQRLLPTGSSLLVCEPATIVTISYSCTDLELEDGMSVDVLAEKFKSAIAKYYETAKSEDSEVRYTMSYAVLAEIEGVVNFENFKLNGSDGPVKLKAEEYPATGTITFSLKA